jgi:hypothetical protein
MNMTGHRLEATFLSYIGRKDNKDSFADDFMQGVAAMEL